MKKLLFVVFVIGGLTSGAHAQGTFQFTANLTPVEPLPPFPVISTGEGVFTLEGNTLRYLVEVTYFAPWTSQIRGPGLDGPVLFNLPFRDCTAPIGMDLGYCTFRGTVELPEPWIADLTASRWYVTAMYHDIFPADVHLRGQVVLVPEPSTLTFIGIAGGLMALRFRLGTRFPLPEQGMGIA